MKNLNNSNRRGGAIAIAIVVLLLITGITASVMLFLGSRQQKLQSQLLAEGYLHFDKGQLEQAHAKFSEAGKTFSKLIELYRKVFSGTYLTADEVNEVVVGLCLSIAHDRFFALESDAGWVKKAETALNEISDSDKRKELSQNVITASEISKLLLTYEAKDYEKAMTDLLEIESKASATDQDFFIFEIRFLIACGKALEVPAILNQARELLFFATTDAGIENEKTRKLWGLLTN